MSKFSKITSRCSALALAAALFAPVQAHAQAQPDGGEDSGEIIVTGSRVRGEAPVGSAVTTLGNADITSSGRVTLDRAIKELPQVFDLNVSENSRGQTGGAGNIVYGNSINLRGIGPNATLILIDGHRVTNNSRSIDPSHASSSAGPSRRIWPEPVSATTTGARPAAARRTSSG